MAKTQNKIIYEQELVNSVLEDFERRRQERLNLEQQWQLNLNYYMGNQYCEVAPSGEIREEDKYYMWQSRNVYNHIAPIIDTRLAKLERVKPIMSVRASGGDENDLKMASISSDILNASFERLNVDKLITKATTWSETTGTCFYKITWNNDGGKFLGEKEKKRVFEGDVSVDVISPFEIFPDSIAHEDINDCKSIIHARAMHVIDVEKLYGVTLQGEDIDAFSLNKSNFSYNGGYKSNKPTTLLHNHALIIEKYEMPCKEYPDGRIITIGGGKLLEICPLPYKNGECGERGFPFVKQCSMLSPGCFFGISVIERLIPLQRSYNALKNRKHEFINRISMGVISVEDGSVDTEDLTDEGLSPGKVIVYRQGAKPPQIMPSPQVPLDFTYEEDKIYSEFRNISGISEASRSSVATSSNMSGVALELLIEQDETRLSQTINGIKNAVKSIGKHILRLFKQFATDQRIMRSAGVSKKVKLFYFKSSDISSDDIIFDTENELSYTPAQKKNAVFEMLSSGLLSDENGALNQRTKVKVLEILGYGSLDNTNDIATLHKNKAEKENLDVKTTDIFVEAYDDHEIHIEEHTRYLLTMDNQNKDNIEKKKIIEHLTEHKKFLMQENLVSEV